MTKLTIAINAGGKSSRMGTDKSFVPFNGKPMIEGIIERLEGLGNEMILISNNKNDYAHLGLPIFGDIYKDHGPLAGIHTAVSHAKHQHILMVACDMPWLNRNLLSYMISQKETADIIVPRWQKFPEPMHAIYSKACLPDIERDLDANLLKIIGFYRHVSVNYLGREVIERFDRNGSSFTNINTPEDLEREEKSG